MPLSGLPLMPMRGRWLKDATCWVPGFPEALQVRSNDPGLALDRAEVGDSWIIDPDAERTAGPVVAERDRVEGKSPNAPRSRRFS
jgi:hypothetical protein